MSLRDAAPPVGHCDFGSSGSLLVHDGLMPHGEHSAAEIKVAKEHCTWVEKGGSVTIEGRLFTNTFSGKRPVCNFCAIQSAT